MNLIQVNDVKRYLSSAKEEQFHFCLSDLPYEINHINNNWDSTRIAFDIELYRLILNVLLPGAFAIFYSSSRTMHRVMCAIEDAGFKLHKTIFAWVFADGNPLGAKNTQRLADNLFAGQYGGYCDCENTRFHTHKYDGRFSESPVDFWDGKDVKVCVECGRVKRNVIDSVRHGQTTGMKNIGGHGYGNNNIQLITEPLTTESESFKDFTHGMGWSKPMLDPIIVAQKPANKPEIANVVKYGTGVVRTNTTNRWPGNFAIQHKVGCTEQKCVSGCLMQQLGISEKDARERFLNYCIAQDDLDAEVFYFARKNADRTIGLESRNNHPSVKPVEVNRKLGEMFLPPDLYAPRRALAPFSGTGSEVIGLAQAGWDYVESIELNNDYADVHYQRYLAYFPEDEIVKVKAE